MTNFELLVATVIELAFDTAQEVIDLASTVLS